jgi:hypothetical protein
MYDKGKILPGLLIFVALVTSPFWWNPLFGKAGVKPEPKLPADKKLQCVLPAAEMKAKHMQVIYDWRETVVRGGGRILHTSDGRTFDMSLSNTCLKQCHESKKQFCDQCHQYLAVQPFCWDCHLVPKETT